MLAETGGARGRIRAKHLPLVLGDVSVHVSSVKVELQPTIPGGVLDLEERNPNAQILAAKVIVPASELKRLARQNAEKAGADIDLALSGKDRFQARGRMPGGVPFTAAGNIKVSDGQLAFAPESISLLPKGAEIHVSLPEREVIARVPLKTLQLALQGPRDQRNNWPLIEPRVSWLAADRFSLHAGLRAGKRVLPLTVQGRMAVTIAEKLRFQLSAIRLELPEAQATVDLATRTAKAQIPMPVIQHGLASQLPLVGLPGLRWLTPNTLQISGEVAAEALRMKGERASPPAQL
ncbi:MAG: hypothetical protein HY692_04115, partial [Cyanobacteria bacterium NC_groundwater_1444_Ag_S-0.65um_54_12]|nr:hypothetical protein [Cyanobacteria bacterium NC_groundwater_1444_Ag_S-0.65um_54_12]